MPHSGVAGAPGRWALVVVAAGGLAALSLAALSLAGCTSRADSAGVYGTPASSGPSRTAASPAPSFAAPAPPPGMATARTPAASSPSPFPAGYAVACGGRPDVGKVVALLRRKGFVGAGTDVVTQLGPLCSGTWQYTVVTVAGQGPLQVVTKGAPTSLELVTAGTDVCSVEVRAMAPPGIPAAANCSQ